MKTDATLGWGKVNAEGAEIWDAPPTFTSDPVTWKDRWKLLFYPKKFFLYGFIARAKRRHERGNDLQHPFRILDVGCGTGAAMIDMKKLFGRRVEVVGVDVVSLQIDLAREKIKQHGVWADVAWYDGARLPFPDQSFDAIYTSDVLGHVRDVPAWLADLFRVLKPGGVLAMFSESELGRHAWIRQYLFDRGFNIDPHAPFHISLYEKKDLRSLIERAGFSIHRMYSAVWASFLLYPDHYHEKLQGQDQFFVLRLVNRLLFWFKKKFHPYTTALVEFYTLVEMLTLGRVIESQGYVVLARKDE